MGFDQAKGKVLVVDDSPEYLRGLSARFGGDKDRMIWVKIQPLPPTA